MVSDCTPFANSRGWAIAEARGWAAYLVALGRSPRTVTAYARTAERFTAYLVAERQLTAWAAVSRADVRAYLSAAYARGLSARSVNLEAAALRSFGRFLAWGGAVDGGTVAPMSVIPRANESHRLPTWLTRAEAARLCNAPDVATAAGLRDRAILEILWATGLRLAELTALNVAQYRYGERAMIVWGKGRRERRVLYGPDADDWTARYLADSRPVLCGWRSASGLRGQIVRYRAEAVAESSRVELALFVGERGGRRISREAVAALVARHATAAGIAKRVTPHTLRHTMATHCFEGGMELRELQTLLGHEYVTTTALYTHVSPERLRASYDSAHPHGGSTATAALAADRRRNWTRLDG